ncbi:MAG: DUF4845 domain-containing protein [Gammaproteobacteria bacterium]|nr:DUF4845 domain-containing protein [Gammaproteobacteria bacterium]
MRNMRREGGMSMMSLMLVLAVVVIFALVAIKVTPIYLENSQIVSAMKRLVQQSEQQEMNLKEVRKGLSSRFSIENIRVIDDRDVDIEIGPDGSVSLYLFYEDRTRLFGNIDLIISFEEEIGASDY